MHRCVRCKKIVGNLEEINDGCMCGSKVFTFIRDEGEKPQAGAGESPKQAPQPASASAPASDQSKAEPKPPVQAKSPQPDKKETGKAPESYFARMTFTTEDVENIKVMSEGVFLVDVNALSRNPVVLKDEEGIYYVKIPFEQNGKKKK